MLWIILLVMIIIMTVIIFFYTLKQAINHYVEASSQNDLSSVGLSAKNFIGLHIKPLRLDHLNPKLIYVRKTTPYKGLILFLPDWQYDFHFYLPFLYWLCRKGYLVVTCQSEKEIYTQCPEELPLILDLIKKDEVLKTYPLAMMGHGSGGYCVLYGQKHIDPEVKVVALSPLPPENESLFQYVQKSFFFSLEKWKKAIDRLAAHRFGCSLSNELPDIITCPTLVILGQDDSLTDENYIKLESDQCKINQMEKKLHHTYLNIKSDLRIQHIQEHLASPDISQFEYDKVIESFDMSILYDLDIDLANEIDEFISQS